MGGTSITHGRHEKFIQNFDEKTRRERYRLRDVNVSGRIILKWTLNKYVMRVETGFIWNITVINEELL
jgi:hypothetical protein